MADSFRVISHPTGRWLVSPESGMCYLVPPDIGRVLLTLDGSSPGQIELENHLGRVVDSSQARVLARTWRSGSPRAAGKGLRSHSRRRRALWYRRTLLPAHVVHSLARQLGCITGWPALIGMALVGVIALALQGMVEFIPAGVGFRTGALAAGLFFGTAVWHELGHAAALFRQGYPPGRIGFGVLFVVPVLYADVTAAGALSRGGRLRVDLAGPCFQLFLAGLFVFGSVCCGAGSDGSGSRVWLATSLMLAGTSGYLAVGWSLLPFVRSDGYWALCDLLNLADLDGSVASLHRSDGPRYNPPGRLAMALASTYCLLNAVFLAALCLWIPLRLTRLLIGLLDHWLWYADHPDQQQFADWLLTGLIVLCCAGVARPLVSLLRRAHHDLQIALGKHPRLSR